MIGLRSGRIVILSLAHVRIRGRNRVQFANVVCDCGNKKVVRSDYMKSNRIRSCGCLKVDSNRELRETHGDSRSSEYNTWCTMIQRCENPNSTKYHLYGARGIKVSKRWRKNYASFLADMGRRPVGKSIDRINVNGHYTRSNCRWATAKEQRANQRKST
jgi:hypothetical protein